MKHVYVLTFRRGALPRRQLLLAAATLLGAQVAVPAEADPIPSIVVFGDSSSDVGSEGFFRRPTNDGQMWSEALAGRLGLGSTPGFARTFDTNGNLTGQTVTGGNNFAVNGATAVPHPGTSSFGEQVDGFVSAKGRFSRRDLVFTWFTRNEITGAADGSYIYDKSEYVTEYIKQINRLKSLGAANIVAVGAEVNLLPTQLTLDGGVTQAQLDTLKAETVAAEAALWPKLAASGVYVLDLNRLAEDVRTRPAKYGFLYTTENYQNRDAQDATPSQLRPNDGNVFTEDGHYTSAMQKVVADFFFAQLRARDQNRDVLVQSSLGFRRDAQDIPAFVRSGLLGRGWGGAQSVSGPMRIYGVLGAAQEKMGSTKGFDTRTSSGAATATFGGDYLSSAGILIGARVAFSQSRSVFGENAGHFDRQAGLVSAYAASQVAPDMRAYGALHVGVANFSTIERKAVLGPAAERAVGKTSGGYASAELGAERDWLMGDSWVAMTGGALSYAGVGLRGYDEQASVLSLSYGNTSYSAMLGTLRLRVERRGTDASFRPFFETAVTHDFLSSDVTVAVGPNRSMIVPYRSDRPARDTVSVTSGVSYEPVAGLSMTGAVSLTQSGGAQASRSIGVTAGLRKTF